MKKIRKFSILLFLCVLLTSLATPVSASAAAKLNKKSITLNVGKTYTLKVSGTKSKIKWASIKKSIATVSSKGTVTAKKKGTAVITAKYGKKKLTCKITVKQPVKSVKLSKTVATLKMGKKLTLKAKVTPSNANNRSISWSSSNKKVATVSSKGVVKAVGNGTATITAKTKDGSRKKATCKITVGKTSTIRPTDPVKVPTQTPVPTPTPTYKTAEITNSNWRNYIEKIEVPCYTTNAFGDFEQLFIDYYYIVKPEYMARLDMAKSSVTAEIVVTCGTYNTTIDYLNKKCTILNQGPDGTKDISNNGKFEALTFVIAPHYNINCYPENVRNLKDIDLFGFRYHGAFSSKYESGTEILFYPTSETVKRITGTLYFNQ